jgi:HNH endonuclease
MNKSPIDRLLAKCKIDPVTKCWIWQGSPTRTGYGRISVHRRMVLVHVLSYEHFVGPVPAGCELHHSCEHRLCANSEHLEPVTRREHMEVSPDTLGCINLRKTHCVHGHLFDEANTYWFRGNRQCRRCKAASERKRKIKMKELK